MNLQEPAKGASCHHVSVPLHIPFSVTQVFPELSGMGSIDSVVAWSASEIAIWLITPDDAKYNRASVPVLIDVVRMLIILTVMGEKVKKL
jgi:hypothetical protein